MHPNNSTQQQIYRTLMNVCLNPEKCTQISNYKHHAVARCEQEKAQKDN